VVDVPEVEVPGGAALRTDAEVGDRSPALDVVEAGDVLNDLFGAGKRLERLESDLG
jgi:hypothetical protein